MLLVSCARGDLRPSPKGVLIYYDHGRREVRLAGKIRVAEELYDAVMRSQPVRHDGRWGKATLEVALAIIQSGREITLAHQVPKPD